ncbi:dirigent protein 22-like [Salvia divinorum]|uniref:Dirigent protein n=1 Tax=Salvia divinorum TaxID=28513 RepID=A0ABD1FTB5_SALDI
MARLCAINTTLILFSVLFPPISMATAIKQSPKAVEDWFDNLKQSQPKVTKLHFYYHNSRNPEMNLSAVQVASAPVFSDQPPYFGVLTITDDPLTVGPEISSKRVGYAQGFYATSSLEEVSMLMGATFIFTDGEYKGSTLAILGRNAIGDRYREMPIVGGTGLFRLARGIVTLQTYFFNFTMALAIVEMNVVALHY